MSTQTKNMDRRLRAAIIVKVIVLIALIWYGIKKGKGVGFYLLSIFIIGPAAAWATFAVSGPILKTDKEETKTEETKKEETKTV